MTSLPASKGSRMGLVEFVEEQLRLPVARPLVLSQDRSELSELTLEQILSTAFEIDAGLLREKFEPRFPEEFKLLAKLHLHPSSYFGRRVQSYFDPYHERFYLSDYQPHFQRLLALAEVGSVLAGSLHKRGVLSAEEEREVILRCLLLEALEPFTHPQIAQPESTGGSIKTPELRARIENALHKRFNLTFEEAHPLVHDIGALSGDEPAAWKEALRCSPAQAVSVSGDLVRLLPRLAQSLTLSFGTESEYKGRHFVVSPLHRAFAESLDTSNKIQWDQLILLTSSGTITTYPCTEVSVQGSRFLGTTFTVTVGIANALGEEWLSQMGLAEDSRDVAACVREVLAAAPVVRPKGSALRLLTKSTSTIASFLF